MSITCICKPAGVWQGVRVFSTFGRGWQTHYDVLGVPKDASLEQVRRTFIEKSKKCHPDINPGNEELHEKFIRLNEAYSILSNPEARASYNYDLASKRYTNRYRKGNAATFRSAGYRNPYKEVHRNSADWSDFYNTYGGGKAYRERQAESETEFWKNYWEQTQKYGGSTEQEGMSPAPKSHLGKEMFLIVTILVVVYVASLIRMFNAATTMDNRSFEIAHQTWLQSKAKEGK